MNKFVSIGSEATLCIGKVRSGKRMVIEKVCIGKGSFDKDRFTDKHYSIPRKSVKRSFFMSNEHFQILNFSIATMTFLICNFAKNL